MTDVTRTIVDYAEQDNAKEMRDAFYSELQNKVMAHIENQKIEVAKTMFNKPETEVEDSVEQ
jgi:hypothetical protein